MIFSTWSIVVFSGNIGKSKSEYSQVPQPTQEVTLMTFMTFMTWDSWQLGNLTNQSNPKKRNSELKFDFDFQPCLPYGWGGGGIHRAAWNSHLMFLEAIQGGGSSYIEWQWRGSIIFFCFWKRVFSKISILRWRPAQRILRAVTKIWTPSSSMQKLSFSFTRWQLKVLMQPEKVVTLSVCPPSRNHTPASTQVKCHLPPMSPMGVFWDLWPPWLITLLTIENNSNKNYWQKALAILVTKWFFSPLELIFPRSSWKAWLLGWTPGPPWC